MWTRCGGVRGARFRYEYRVERDGELVVEGDTRHATVDRETHDPCAWPTGLAEAVARAEARRDSVGGTSADVPG